MFALAVGAFAPIITVVESIATGSQATWSVSMQVSLEYAEFGPMEPSNKQMMPGQHCGDLNTLAKSIAQIFFVTFSHEH